MGFIVSPDSKALTYMGRTEMYKGMTRFVFAGTSVTLRFRGTGIKAVICDHRFFNIIDVGTVIDGRIGKLRVTEDKTLYTLAEGLEDTEHEVTLYKRQDASHYFEFGGFELADGAELLPAKPLPSRRIECYGDSVSAGAVTRAMYHTASCDPDDTRGLYDDSWYSFPMITARNLGAQINNIAQGGISILNGTGWYHAPDFIGMETAYDKVCYFPEAEGGMTEWNFTRYTPQLVIFAVGQNDQHNEKDGDPDITDRAFREMWKSSYKKIILSLRDKYPRAVIVLTLTVLCHPAEWDTAIDEIAEELSDPDILRFRFTRSGKATPGHPRITEQYEMAEELTAFITNMGDKLWQR